MKLVWIHSHWLSNDRVNDLKQICIKEKFKSVLNKESESL